MSKTNSIGIKKIHELTIGDIDLMETTGEISQFRKRFNPIPARFQIRAISSLVDETIRLINKGDYKNLDVAILEYECSKFYEIQMLMALDNLLTSTISARSKLLVMSQNVSAFAPRVLRRKLRKVTDQPEILRFCSEKIKALTGIDLDTVEDILKFKGYIRIKSERMTEYYAKKKVESEAEKSGEKRKLIAVAFSYINFLEMSISNIESMKVLHFIEIRNLANEKNRQLQAQIDKTKMNG